jgi:hypothetical protein
MGRPIVLSHAAVAVSYDRGHKRLLPPSGPVGRRTAKPAPYNGGEAARKSMTPLSAFGLFAVTLMVVSYALERQSPWFILAFASACVLGAIYGFLQGAWPFGLVEAVWSAIALRRWWSQRNSKVDGAEATNV